MNRISFGTDGWRAIIADGVTFANVRLVAGAIADYLQGRQSVGQGVVVCYDTRFFSEKFACAVAEVLLEAGIPVFWTKTFCPTPVTSFGVLEQQAAGGVMITASHNPPGYTGIKFIPEYGSPALPEVTGEIERLIDVREGNAVLAVEPLPDARICQLEPSFWDDGSDQGPPPLGRAVSFHCLAFRQEQFTSLVTELDLRTPYLNRLEAVVDLKVIRNRPLRVVVDSMYGAGMNYLDTFLRRGYCQVESIHDYRDPLFGGLKPQPMARWLLELRERVVRSGADLGLALDGDADRFGVVDRDGRFFTANEMLPLLLDYVLQTREYRGPVARSLATTHMLDRIAEKFGLPMIETPVGFKYVGQAFREQGAAFGGEESGGMSIHGHIPQKDGIMAAALVAEMVAARQLGPTELQERLQEEYGSLLSEQLDFTATPERKARLAEIAAQTEWRSLGGKAVQRVDRRDGLKLWLEDDCWVLVRPSGTEPKIRLYVEACDQETLAAVTSAATAQFELAAG